MWQASHLCPVLSICLFCTCICVVTCTCTCICTRQVLVVWQPRRSWLEYVSAATGWEQHTHHNVTPYLYLYFYLYLYLYLRLCLRLCFYWNPCQQQLAGRSILIARKYHPPVGLFCVVSISCLLGCGRGCLLHYISNKQWFAYKSPSQFTSTDQKNYFQHIFTQDNAC